MGDLFAGRPVKSATHTQMQQNRHHMHARQGALITGHYFDPFFATSSAVYVQESASGDADLGELATPFRLHRTYGNGTAQSVGVTLWVYGRFFEVEVLMYAVDTQALVHTFNFSNATGSDLWVNADYVTTEANARIGGVLANDPRLYVLRPFIRKSGAGDARIEQLILHERTIDALDL